MMNRTYRTPSLSGGFSLIEVMIAVVVLATGLLALAALQASLTRASADSKSRGRVAAMLSARMDELRSVGYDNTILDPGTITANAVDDCDNDATDWLDCTRVQANLGALTVRQVNTLMTSAVGAANFAAVNARGAVTEGNPEYIRVDLTATWKTPDDNTDHSMTMTSEFSALALRDSLLPPPPGSNTPTGGPIVRTDNPAGPGVIPVAVGGGDATAASNPRPEMIGKKENQTVGTRFDILTYSGMLGTSVIQRRVETTVVKCQCRLGAGGSNLPTIYQKSEWPAVWTGERYDLYKPTTAILPPGQGKNSGPKPGIDQSPLCQECCRDHFDGNSTTHAKFDPERTGAHDHFTVTAQGTLVKAAATDLDYIDACRIIRVDGFWRTAADMYSRQFGLLATETVGGKEAATGLPATTAVTNYQAFVKDYLKQINGNSGAPPTNAQTLFDETARALNDPDDVDIIKPDSKDPRYLHGRGLYIDYLEDKARAKIKAILADNGPNGKCPTGSDVAECILPYLPFTTVNVTELADWKASNAVVLSVNSQTKLGTNPLQPSGGLTLGVKKGIADNQVGINMSNFGLAATSDPLFVSNTGVKGVDDLDAAAQGSDKQTFDVGGDNAPPSSGDQFTVTVDSQDPDVFYLVGATDAGECLRPGANAAFVCSTSTDGFVGGRVTLKNYWFETKSTLTRTATCTDNKGDPHTVTVSRTDVPTFNDFYVNAIRIGVAGEVGQFVSLSGDKTKAESVTYRFDTLKENDVVVVDLEAQTLTSAEKYATVASCTTNGGGTQMNDVVWNRPWGND